MLELKRQANLSLLTIREKEILLYIMKGYSREEISQKLFLSFHTVNTHFKHIFAKMQVHSIPELIIQNLVDENHLVQDTDNCELEAK
jgi:LuxR family transcriptional regulator, maltose regulon positive regulatory protein